MTRALRIAAFLAVLLAAQVITRVPFVDVTPWWLGLYTLATAVGLVVLLSVVGASWRGQRGVQAVLLVTWCQCLPVLALSPPMEYQHSFDTTPWVYGRGVTILARTGWVQMTDGLGLAPGTSGDLLVQIDAPPLRAVYLQPLVYAQWGATRFENAVELSRDGTHFTPLSRDVTLADGRRRINGPLGPSRLWVRVTARNPAASPVLVVDHLKVFTGRVLEWVLALAALLGLLFSHFGARLAPLRRVATDLDTLFAERAP